MLKKYYDKHGKINFAQVARDFNVPYNRIYSRVTQYHWTLAQALDLEPLRDDQKSIKQLCKERNLCYNTVLQRVKYGASLEEALAKPVRKRVLHEVGDSPSLRALCIKHGLHYQTVYHRYVRLGETLEDALANGKQKTRTYYTYKGETEGLKYFARKYNMHASTLWRRVKTYNMSIEEAIETPIVHGYHLRRKNKWKSKTQETGDNLKQEQ